MISRHVAYKMKVNGDETLKLQADGNCKNAKDGIRKGSANARFPVIRLMLSLSALMGLRVGTIEISAVYLQPGPVKRDIFVLPPKENRDKRVTIRKLLKLPYGTSEAGR